MNTLVYEIIKLFGFTLLYFQLDSLLKPFVFDKFEIFHLGQGPRELVLYDEHIFPIIQSANVFNLSILCIFTVHLLVFSKIKKYAIFSMASIYAKYISNEIILGNTITLYEHDYRRIIMWLFTTPLILKMYGDMNQLTLYDVNAQYHILSNGIHILVYPFCRVWLHQYANTILFLSLFLFEAYFIYRLFEFKQKRYTQFIIYIWTLFSFIALLEEISAFSADEIYIFYMLSDMVAKLTIMIIVVDHEEQIYNIKTSVDLQSVSLLSAMKKSIKRFEGSTNITPACNRLILQLNSKLSSFVPTDTTDLKLELLKKILPLELEDRYLTNSKEYKTYEYVCVLFTDIVSYTELAKAYPDDVIYKMLNDIYTRFDDIVLRYGNLQKIETIGDAYMVVGDIFSNEVVDNGAHKRVRSIILMAMEFMNEIRNVKSPNNKPLQLRIGINIGKVIVGILGVEIPRLCVIGNTVNVAARLQTTADPGTIQISRHVYEIAQETDFGRDVDFLAKENVFLKNIGTTTTYILGPN